MMHCMSRTYIFRTALVACVRSGFRRLRCLRSRGCAQPPQRQDTREIHYAWDLDYNGSTSYVVKLWFIWIRYVVPLTLVPNTNVCMHPCMYMHTTNQDARGAGSSMILVQMAATSQGEDVQYVAGSVSHPTHLEVFVLLHIICI